jgi:hypothetical protein
MEPLLSSAKKLRRRAHRWATRRCGGAPRTTRSRGVAGGSPLLGERGKGREGSAAVGVLGQSARELFLPWPILLSKRGTRPVLTMTYAEKRRRRAVPSTSRARRSKGGNGHAPPPPPTPARRPQSIIRKPSCAGVRRPVCSRHKSMAKRRAAATAARLRARAPRWPHGPCAGAGNRAGTRASVRSPRSTDGARADYRAW